MAGSMASSMGKPTETPADLRKVLRGICFLVMNFMVISFVGMPLLLLVSCQFLDIFTDFHAHLELRAFDNAHDQG